MSEEGISIKEFMFAFQENEAKYKQIYNQIKLLIETGQLVQNEVIPSIRKLADTLGVSRNTTLTAYEQLVAEGYIRGETKKGYFVNSYEPIYLQSSAHQREELSEPRSDIRIDFRAGAVDAEHFPLKVWRKYANQELNKEQAYTYGDLQGELLLRQQIAKYLLQSRGVKVDSEEIIIGSGTQQLLLYLSILLKGRFDSIFLENPGYNGAHTVFSMQHFQICPLTVTDQGYHLHELTNQARLVYVTPSHQFPYGVSMPVQQRLALMKWAANDGYIIEDDYDSEFRYSQKPFPALASINRNRVIYVGTFSKSFLPSLRLSYMILPKSLLRDYQEKFSAMEQTASSLHQLTLAQFMKTGEWDKHIRKMRLVYKRKMNLLVNQLRMHFGTKISIIGEQSGLYVLVRVHTEQSEQWLIDEATKSGVKVYPTSPYFFSSAGEPLLQLGFSNLTFEEIEEGIKALKRAWKIF